MPSRSWELMAGRKLPEWNAASAWWATDNVAPLPFGVCETAERLPKTFDDTLSVVESSVLIRCWTS